MRATLLGLCILGLGLPARADAPSPIAIEPFTGRCFDAAALGARVRAAMPDADISIGAPPRGGHQSVRVREEGGGLAIEVIAIGPRHRVIGSERRLLPAGDCAALLDAATEIVVRAATPLHAPRVRPVPPPRPRYHRPRAPQITPPAAPIAPAPSTRSAPSAPAPSPEPVSPTAPPPTPPPIAPPTRTPEAAPAPSPPTPRVSPRPPPRQVEPAPIVPSSQVTRRPPPPGRRRGEIDAAAMWAFPLDGGPSNPAGELAVGYSWPRIGVALRVGVEGEGRFTATSSAGVVSITTRRVPLSAELHLDVRVRGGALRFGAGPELALWLASSGGLPRPVSRVLAEPAATVRASYRLELGRVVLGFGVDLDVAFLADDLAIGGVGTVARTPLIQLAPYLSLGTQIF